MTESDGLAPYGEVKAGSQGDSSRGLCDKVAAKGRCGGQTFQVQGQPVQMHALGKTENDGFKEETEADQRSRVAQGQNRVKWGQKGSKDPDRGLGQGDNTGDGERQVRSTSVLLFLCHNNMCMRRGSCTSCEYTAP